MSFHPRLLGLFFCAGLGACAAYHPAPLASVPPLRDSVASLRHTLPDGGEVGTVGPLSLRDVGALAVLNDPNLVAARAQHDISAAELLAAGELPNPSFTGGFAALLGGPASMSAINAGFTQDLGALITYRVNRQAAASGLAQVDAGILWQEWQVASQAEQFAVSFSSDEATVASLAAEADVLAGVDRDTGVEIAQHNLTLNDGATSMAALAGVQSLLDVARLAAAHDRDQLDALLGLEPDTAIPLAPPNVAPLPPSILAPAFVTLAQRRPDLIALRYGYAVADARLRAAIMTQFLPMSVGAAGGRDTSGVDSAGPQVTLTLPLFNRNRGGIAIAQATRAALAAQYQAALASAAGGARALSGDIVLLRSQETAAQAAAQNASAMLEAAQSAYAAGQISAMALANLQTAAGDRLRAKIALRGQVQSAEISLATLLGLGLPPLGHAPEKHAR
ncbi:TolC family protein [Acidocella sp.]|jgi:outer membrane protein TolC|uniref:TolC family protein n=1 Tax=Acidocella sp. TaxID=50710 RepID=UPI002F42F815